MAYVSSGAWTEARKKEIIDRLQKKGLGGRCPMCGNQNFTLLDGFFNHSVQLEPSGALVIGGPSIPTIAIVCTNCGFLSQHAAGALGLLPAETKQER